MILVNWNVAWCGPRSERAALIRRRIRAHKPDVVSLTEVSGGLLAGGHAIASDPDYGYGDTGLRRKNQLWSRQAWTHMDQQGHPDIPPGRFVFGETADGSGKSWRIISLCIPWRGAHVSTGRKDKKSWQEHEACLEGLRPILKKLKPHVITGDFNQRLPFDPKYQVPKRLHEKLEAVFSGYEIVTQALHPKLIDHTAVASAVRAAEMTLISNKRRGVKDLTDHLGTVVILSRR